MEPRPDNGDTLLSLDEANFLVMKASARLSQYLLEISLIQRAIESLGTELRKMRDQFLLPALSTETTYLLDDGTIQHSMRRAESRLNGLASWFTNSEAANQSLLQAITEILTKYQDIAALIPNSIALLPAGSVIPFAELGVRCTNAVQDARALLKLLEAQKQGLLTTAELVAAVLAAIKAIREGDVPRSTVVELLSHPGFGK